MEEPYLVSGEVESKEMEPLEPCFVGVVFASSGVVISWEHLRCYSALVAVVATENLHQCCMAVAVVALVVGVVATGKLHQCCTAEAVAVLAVDVVNKHEVATVPVAESVPVLVPVAEHMAGVVVANEKCIP